jgi:hypothetical protein
VGQLEIRGKRTFDSIVEMGRICAHAEDHLPKLQKLQLKTELITRMNIDKSTFSKLVAIGRDTRLLRPEVSRTMAEKRRPSSPHMG